MIGNDEILTMLRSRNPDTVLDALFAMTGDKALTLSVSTLDVAQSCFRHSDPDIRRQAVIAVGIQIDYSPAFPALVELLKTEDDEDVADAMIWVRLLLGNEKYNDSARFRAEILEKGVPSGYAWVAKPKHASPDEKDPKRWKHRSLRSTTSIFRRPGPSSRRSSSGYCRESGWESRRATPRRGLVWKVVNWLRRSPPDRSALTLAPRFLHQTA